MNDFLGLYRNLESGIRNCEEQHEDLKKCIECCFHLCEIASADTTLAAAAGFKTEEEEIDFFKNIKPLFTGYVEFYSILYSAELFVPEDAEDALRFRAEELNRSLLFLDKHQDFCDYLHRGDTSLDREYFLQRPDGVAAEKNILLAQIRGRQRYIVYLRERFPGL